MEGGRYGDEEGLSDAKHIKIWDSGESTSTSSVPAIVVFDDESDSILCYKPSMKCWYRIQYKEMKTWYGDFNAVVVDDNIYVLIEDSSVYRLKYSDKNATWRRMTDMKKDHGQWPPAAVLNGFIYVVGKSYCDASAKCEVFYPSTNKWKSLHHLNKERYHASVIAAKGYIYCIGGVGENGDGENSVDLNTVERYDPHSNTWSYVASMKQPRHDAAAVEFNDKIYVMGGKHEDQPLSDVECYDPAIDTWTSIASMLTPCGWCTACILDKKIFVFERGVSEQILQMFDFQKNEWEYFDEVVGIKTNCSVNSSLFPDHSNLVFVPKRISPIPEIPKVEAVKEVGGIKVSWQKLGAKIVSYYVLVFHNGKQIHSKTVKEPKFFLEHPKSPRKYFFRVSAQNCLRFHGKFTQSNVINTCVTDVKAIKNKDDILVSWQTHDVSEGDLICIQAFCDGKKFGEIQTTSKSSFCLESASPYVKYFFEIWIQNSSQEVAEKISSNDVRMLTYLGKGVYYDEHRSLREGYKVYQGELIGSDVTENVAVKLLDFKLDPKAKREVENMVKVINHPNIVLYRMSGSIQNQTFIAMEICDKDTLWELVKEKPTLSLEFLKTSLLQITHSLQYIHDNDILHRDLKPQNILLSLDKKNMKLADFGLSKKIDPNKSMCSLSLLEVRTEGWGSPEQYAEIGKMSKRSEIFSLGLIYYFVLSKGKHAFGPVHHFWKSNIMKGEGMNLDDLRCPDPEIAKDLITSMLKTEQKLRPTAEKVLKHPFFWDDNKKLEFLCKISDAFQPVDSLPVKIAECESKASELIGDGWLQKMILNQAEKEKFPGISGNGPVYDKAIPTRKKNYKCNHTSVKSLLRFIRNRRHHYREDGEEIFRNTEDIWKFFSVRFPKLFAFTFNLMKDEQRFKEYLNDKAKNNTLPEK